MTFIWLTFIDGLTIFCFLSGDFYLVAPFPAATTSKYTLLFLCHLSKKNNNNHQENKISWLVGFDIFFYAIYRTCGNRTEFFP
ncbi:MAG: hypothetical protein ACR2NY_05855 [Alphaproteobacteria bacterium]